MYKSRSIRCEYQYWWNQKEPQSSQMNKENSQTFSGSLPLPALPPALDFDPYNFTLPPSYEEAADLEKALYQPRSRQSFCSDVRTQCNSSYSTHPRLSVIEENFPPKTFSRRVRAGRCLRYTIFTVYRRLFTLVVLLNFIGVLLLLHQFRPWQDQVLNVLAVLASSNFLLAIVIRQDYLINLLFRSAWLAPWFMPLRIRRVISRVYCYGGIHSGAAVAGTLWWSIFTVDICWTFATLGRYTLTTITIALLASMLLIIILLLALPGMRQRCHDTFELTHRFLGWTSVALFWAQVILLAQNKVKQIQPPKSLGFTIVRDPTFWNLVIITLLLIYPWLHLRRWTFSATVLSSHAVRLSFTCPVHKFSCLSISSSPLFEWHPFATFPSTDPTQPCASMVISSAGNWTRNLIQSIKTRTKANGAAGISEEEGIEMHFWVKSHPKAGVLSLSCLFSRVLILTTGSGIGPSLSSLLDRPAGQHARLIWSTRSPLQTYGSDILALVDAADPDALVIDTDEMGRPNLLETAWGVYKSEELEAVFVLSNEKVVKQVVGGLERRGVPAFGPIWDS